MPPLTDQPDPPWPDSTRPAGTLYDDAEWAKARAAGQQIVIELREADFGLLLVADRPPQPVMRKEVRGGRVEEVLIPVPSEEAQQFMDPFLASMLEDCLLLGPGASTSHPGSVSGHLVLEHAVLGDRLYRIVRPEAHRESRPWFFGMTGRHKPPPGEPQSLDFFLGKTREASVDVDSLGEPSEPDAPR
ncbi:hypothetical protein QRD43_20710 [Pelomonas sp. APW6]|uniref:Uncharacterized protein n=1 Tax=Roseateles subflavus TaxID=3053353 RepID=A0ABT7LN86_9BURK|nr:hypothetical protein [Pelomonas sp. APW6]MDL5034336.1 hypothetical protein [Pelomonas sp. APW6]